MTDRDDDAPLFADAYDAERPVSTTTVAQRPSSHLGPDVASGSTAPSIATGPFDAHFTAAFPMLATYLQQREDTSGAFFSPLARNVTMEALLSRQLDLARFRLLCIERDELLRQLLALNKLNYKNRTAFQGQNNCTPSFYVATV
jgi:hypothetical protein